MAGDWIKMRSALHEDPAVTGIAEATGLDAFAVVGRLHRLWAWADQQSRDGHAAFVTTKWIDVTLGCDGFATAMVKVGWLEASEGGITFPKFDRHNGKSAKNRVLAADRKALERSRKSHAGVTKKSRLEKRREEGNTSTHDSKNEDQPLNPQTSQEERGEARPKVNGYSAIARGVLTFLNERAGKAFHPTSVNLDLIVDRLKEGYTEAQCRQVVVRKAREWKGTEFETFLRPATLFNRTKFSQYAGELVVEPAPVTP